MCPAKILQVISCGCKKGCKSQCGCYKLGIKCRDTCRCLSEACQNKQTDNELGDIDIDDEIDDDDDEINDDGNEDDELEDDEIDIE